LDGFVRWLASNFRYILIPAARNIADYRRSVFSELVDGAISAVSQSRKRIEALERFYADVTKQLTKVEDALARELRLYLPNIKKIDLVTSGMDLFRFISVQDVEIDDGAHTSLRQKGDGFKSLFALSVLQFVEKQRYGKNIIFGIEEPESHLHSSAIYELKSTLRELGASFQILVTTHSPILIQRDNIDANIIVDQTSTMEFSSTAKPARTLSQVRQSLGVRPQDNMSTAEVVVVAEGTTEEIALPPLISRVKPSLADAFAAGRVRVISAGSASGVLAMVRMLARDAASCLIFLDSDKEGKVAFQNVESSGLVDPADVFLVPGREGCSETEFEDLFESSLYLEEMARTCGVSLTKREFERVKRQSGTGRTRYGKWSQVMKKAVRESGKNWDSISGLAKRAVATSIAKRADSIPASELIWTKSMGGRIEKYLAEERALSNRRMERTRKAGRPLASSPGSDI